jgi:hypothetical protein
LEEEPGQQNVTQPVPILKEQRRKQREKEKIRARREQRVTYDLPPALRKRIKELAEEQCLPASQLVTLAMLLFLNSYDQGEISVARYKEPSRSPRYDWNLKFPSDLTASLRKKKKE